jgi:hypothetical protein
MTLTEFHDTNALLEDRAALAARHRQEGCLFVRGAIDAGSLAEQAAALLERCRVARREDSVRATDFTGNGYETTVTKADGSKVEVHLDGS